jgi:diacylglycerol kinase (ATP)
MESKLKFCAVVNANALRNQKLLNQVIDLLKNNHEIEIFETKSKEEARDIFKKLSLKLFDRLIITGGDGSFNFAVNEVIKYPSLSTKEMGYIPLGTANILQIEANIKKKAKDVYETLISKNTKKIYLAKANNDYFFLMLGVGFDGTIVASIHSGIKKYLGKLIFIIKSLQHFLFLKNEKIKVSLDNKTYEANWVLITNARYYAGQYSISKKTNIFENGLITYVFQNLTRMNLMYYVMLVLFKGDLAGTKNIITSQAQKIKVTKTTEPLNTQLDGEYFGLKDEIQIEETDKYINFLSK